MSYLSTPNQKYRGSKNKKSGSKSGPSSYANKGKAYRRGPRKK